MAIEKVAQPPVSFEAGPDLAGKQCSICQTGMIAGERVVTCGFCGLPFHLECWNENRGCSAYGCEGAPKTIKTETAAEPLSNAWGDEKACPSCDKTIKSNAVKCRFCGATFASRDVIDKKEYLTREYEEKEFVSARNKIVVIFLLSAAGCLAPAGLIISLMLIVGGGAWGMEFKRLPAALKAVLYCAAGISSLLIFLMIVLALFDR